MRKNLVENWFLRPIEDKLNQEKNKTDEFRKLAFQFIEQYKRVISRKFSGKGSLNGILRTRSH